MQKRLATIDAEIADGRPAQAAAAGPGAARSAGRARLGRREQTVDLAALENEFVAAAKGYGERKGITYAAWREVGVPGGDAEGRRDQPAAG